MHFNLGFSTVQVLWTLTFASLLVLLVVLLGRDRARRYPLFTASIVVAGLRLLASRLLFERLAPTTLNAIFLSLADLAVIYSRAGGCEKLARRAFPGAPRRAWFVGAVAVVAVAAAVVGVGGPWPYPH